MGMVKTAKEVKEVVDAYNKACKDFNNAQTMSDIGQASLAATRAMEALAGLAGVRLSGDPGEIAKAFDKYMPTQALKDGGITSPEVYRSLGLPVPKFDQNGGTCPIVQVDTRSWWQRAKDFIQRRDPLTFDLDGDGLETVGVAATNPILFDHDADGIKTGTGWVQPDDAFLVMDKNGNGTIDTGRELFGDSTIKNNGQLATDGFDALTDLDSIANGGNNDGIVNASDSQYAGLRLWRDLNQDGISQTGELFTLASQNIIGINTGISAHSQTLPNGNQIADKGTFIKSNGTLGELGDVTGNLADINLASDTFHRTFTTALDTTSVANLPDMQGSGVVRDLREATTQSATLQTLLTNYSAATTRAAQMAQLDQLLDAWADTGGMAETLAQRVAANDEDLDKVALELNQRPRKTLGYKTPTEVISNAVALTP